jgi:acyl-CoA thioester hydrolase
VSDPVFRRARTVRDRDVDALGHVNNAVWVGFVVELAEAHARSLGLGHAAVRAMGMFWIVRRHEIDYLAPALAGEEIREETWVEELRGARSLRASRFTRVSDGTELVRARTQWAFVASDTMRPRRVPAEIAARFPLHVPEGG